ncbi:hypothetical protein [Candidatus Protochlamydia amoebophila]|uniref:Uncharacterized protein n=1 Tax=Candidatus Protochlamydia amoebophila TaxID=362787 RepID=A0A0C1HAG0_9BACT|nr:hypothetical protein [Candidatus Protochlamydia amoebophila]KIC74354.1 hypothetical protein DB44_AL00480 [Candidatus Protochlamydia amoebophila]
MNFTSAVFQDRLPVQWSTLSSNMKILVKELAETAKETVSLPSLKTKKAFFKAIQEKQRNLRNSYHNSFWGHAIRHLESFEDWEFTYLNNPFIYVEFLNSQRITHQAARTQLKIYETAHNIAQIILQHSSSFQWKKTCALQLMVCDMWNTFVASSSFCTASHCLPPIAKWAEDEIDHWALFKHSIKKERAISINGLEDSIPIVSFPLSYSSKGILSWLVLARETAHTILETNPKAKKILSNAIKKDIYQALEYYPEDIKKNWANYWGNRFSEIGADVMAILYMGPAAAIGLIAFLRSHRPDQTLSNNIDLNDSHLAGTLRGLLVAHAVSYLNISVFAKTCWVNYLLHEVEKNFDKTNWEFANICARQVAKTIMHTPISGNQSLKDIKCWSNEDENLVAYYLDGTSLNKEFIHYKAPHIIASANLHLLLKVQLHVSNDGRIGHIFNQMIDHLYKKGQAQTTNRNCLSCSITQRDIFPYCPAPAQETSHSNPITKVKKIQAKNAIDPLIVVAIVVIFFGVIILTENSKKE